MENRQTIDCTLEKEGFLAHYYPGTRAPEKAVIAVGGAFCDEKSSIAMAGFLRNAGWNVLVLGFYLWKGLSKDLISVPVDYVQKAVSWLKKEQGIEKIAMTGASTGALYTLLSASLIPDITCIVPVVPYDHVFEGNKSFKPVHCSSFSFHGEDIPYSGDAPNAGALRIARTAMRLKEYGLSRFMRMEYDYLEGLIKPVPVVEKDLKMMNYRPGEGCLNPLSRVKIENMNADVLFLAVEDDDCWPSEVASRRMVKKLEEVSYPHRVEWHIYEKASHILIDGLDQFGFSGKMLANLMIPAEKKHPQACEAARQDSLQRIHKFLEEW